MNPVKFPVRSAQRMHKRLRFCRLYKHAAHSISFRGEMEFTDSGDFQRGNSDGLVPTGLSPTSKRADKGRAPDVPLCMERLEPRPLLDASATLVGGLLSVVAGPEKEVLQLTLNTATAQLVVSDSGKQIGQFASASVNQITINTGNANDRVRIAGNVLQPATLQAGNGNVDFEAGGGPTTFNVGNGNDKLVGGAAPSIFTAGNGADTIISGSGQDLIQVGSGKDRIFVRGNDVVIPTAPPGNYTLIGEPTSTPSPSPDPPAPPPVLTPGEVNTLLSRAAAATTSNDAIVVVVDREGNPLGVRVEGNVSTAITGNTGNLVFAIDGALAEARTGTFFANNDAPLTSRTIEFISQSTITQREVESNPSITNPNSTIAGPGLVAPVGVGGHFPPGINDTPQVDLFDIENTNRDSSLDVTTGNRFNVPSADIPPGQGLPFPDSYGVISGTEPNARRAASAPCRAAYLSKSMGKWWAGSASSSPAPQGPPTPRTPA